MAEPWVLVPCLASLRAELNALAPGRDKRSDGTIGDRAHQDRPSDHNPDESGETPYEDGDRKNEVHAFDADDTGPYPVPFVLLWEEIAKRHRLGLDDRLQNLIYNGRIASRSWGWTWRDYTGANRHTEHGHASARYTSAHENDTKPWGLLARFGPDREDPDVPLSKDMIKLTQSTADELGGNYKAGTEHSAATLLQLAVIYAARADDKAQAAVDLVKSISDDVAALVRKSNTGGSTPPSTPPEAAAAPRPAAPKPAGAAKPGPSK